MNMILTLENDPGAAVLYQHCGPNSHKLILCTSPGRGEQSCVVWLNDRQLNDLRLALSPEIESLEMRVSA